MTKVNHGDDLQRLAGLLRARNANEVEITQVIGRPAQLSHIGDGLPPISGPALKLEFGAG